MKRPITAALAALALTACQHTDVNPAPSGPPPRIEAFDFGRTSNGTLARAWRLTNSNGLTAVVTDYGATLVSLMVPDSDGVFADVVLGFDDVAGYESANNQYFGCTAGRVANRIERGVFELDGAKYQLATNNAPNHLHGGARGFGQRFWTEQGLLTDATRAAVTFVYVSIDGEEGYPGTLTTHVTYELNNLDELVVEYSAVTDAPTPVNLTHHSYFNLAGAGAETVLDHELLIEADRYTPTDDTLIPTGEFAKVRDTALDFRKARVIGARIAQLDDTPATGYDHNFVLRDAPLEPKRKTVVVAGPVCRLSHRESGRIMEISTDQVGLQLYTGNYLFGQAGKGGVEYPHRSAVCLETQNHPNAVNEPRFPSSVLRPGETYRHVTIHRFLTR
jgi:aldose 1-epimerase